MMLHSIFFLGISSRFLWWFYAVSVVQIHFIVYYSHHSLLNPHFPPQGSSQPSLAVPVVSGSPSWVTTLVRASLLAAVPKGVGPPQVFCLQWHIMIYCIYKQINTYVYIMYGFNCSYDSVICCLIILSRRHVRYHTWLCFCLINIA